MKGIATRGNSICFGKFALQALEPAWITSRQIEAGRRAITRYARRGGNYGYVYFQINLLLCDLQKHVWVQEKVRQNIGYL